MSLGEKFPGKKDSLFNKAKIVSKIVHVQDTWKSGYLLLPMMEKIGGRRF